MCNSSQAHLPLPRVVVTRRVSRQQSWRGLCSCVSGLASDQMQSTLTGSAPNYDCTMDSLDDLNRLLSNSADFTDFVTAPTLPSVYSQPKALQGENNAGRLGTLRQDDAPDKALQGRKQRALDKSREAQKRFRQRQKVGVWLLKLLRDTSFLSNNFCACRPD